MDVNFIMLISWFCFCSLDDIDQSLRRRRNTFRAAWNRHVVRNHCASRPSAQDCRVRFFTDGFSRQRPIQLDWEGPSTCPNLLLPTANCYGHFFVRWPGKRPQRPSPSTLRALSRESARFALCLPSPVCRRVPLICSSAFRGDHDGHTKS